MSNEITKEVQQKIDVAKTQGHVVYSLKIAGKRYIYRSINREEFKDLQAKLTADAEKVRASSDEQRKDLPEGDPRIAELEAQLETAALRIRDQGEERLVETGLLSPEKLTGNTPAGVISNLSEKIMEGSGFQVSDDPEIL